MALYVFGRSFLRWNHPSHNTLVVGGMRIKYSLQNDEH